MKTSLEKLSARHVATPADLQRLAISIHKTAFLLDVTIQHVAQLVERGVLRRLKGTGAVKITVESIRAMMPDIADMLMPEISTDAAADTRGIERVCSEGVCSE